MDADITARLIYLVLLGAAVAGSLLLSGRARAGTVARNVATWGLIFVGLLAGYALWSDVRSVVQPSRALVASDGTISARRGDDGHFHLTLRVGGTPVRFLVDTGASDVVLSEDDARRLGIDPSGL
ncbi:MAG: retroviral-like aspartic protease family protein, partial [Rhodobacteraceae bacterium]|nr:retroviral-like aspartic protease family protein [Paracoccaceae bacterium]